MVGVLMRSPSTMKQIYGWHMAALRGENPPVYEDDPQCGYFAMRMVKGGPFVPVEIKIERDIDTFTGELMDDERIVCTVGDDLRDPSEVWIWASKRPISKAEFNSLRKASKAEAFLAATHVPVDLTQHVMRP